MIPGEISLAHNGVLFLDELPEFKRAALEVMRQPLEERKVRISRAKFTVEFPCSFMLIASMNPCPCGPNLAQRYRSKISGPLLDRINLHIEVQPVAFKEFSSEHSTETSEQIRQTNTILKKNRQILQNLNPTGMVKTTRKTLVKKAEFPRLQG